MDDNKPLASLSSALLARKGGASPAMTPELQQKGEVVPISRAVESLANEVHTQQDRLSASFTARGHARRSAFDHGGRAAFTLRLDEERHLRLRLACTAANRSAQQIVTEALDQFLAGQPAIDVLAGQIQRKRSH